MNKIKYIAAVLIAIAGMGLQQAHAFTSLLDVGNDAISGYTGPYGTMVVTLVDSTHASITFTSNVVGGNIYLFGDGGTVGVNVNAAGFAVSDFMETNSGTGFTPTFDHFDSGNVSTFGVFNLVVDNFDGFKDSADFVSFTLTNTSGTWGSDADVLVSNAQGFDAVAHIFITTSPANAKNGAIVTGFAGETGQPNVPDGGTTVMLLGLGLGALGMARRFLTR